MGSGAGAGLPWDFGLWKANLTLCLCQGEEAYWLVNSGRGCTPRPGLPSRETQGPGFALGLGLGAGEGGAEGGDGINDSSPPGKPLARSHSTAGQGGCGLLQLGSGAREEAGPWGRAGLRLSHGKSPKPFTPWVLRRWEEAGRGPWRHEPRAVFSHMEPVRPRM